jgi:hypothetical protein
MASPRQANGSLPPTAVSAAGRPAIMTAAHGLANYGVVTPFCYKRVGRYRVR